jgi:alginate O-acetyltransferase complex protein AlgI
MLFNTTQFFVFLLVVLTLFYAAPQGWRRYILLAASYYFYVCWNAKFLLLLLTLTATDYLAALWIARSWGLGRRVALVAGLAANLSFLGYFKYYNFFARTLAQTLGVPSPSWVHSIILPMGISFHTFQSMSYIIDVYRKEQEPVRSPIDYALFIAFFPQLVAGPIVRAHEFFKDLFHWRPPDTREALLGVLQILLGLTKKRALADPFALVADAYFGNPAATPGLRPAWGAVVAFALQIFFDFSGYSDIAIGAAKLLGFRFPANFERPYLAASITEFWRRWHMSLSRWLRDYLYIPLGGNRGGALHTYRNLMLTMLLGGLWHGASWNFVIWGGYHGVLLSLERVTGWNRIRAATWLRVPLTFVLVCVGWVFFRATTLSGSVFVLQQMFTAGGPGPGWGMAWWHFWLALGALTLALWEEKRGWFEAVAGGPAWRYSAVVFVLLACLELFGVTDLTMPFVYFQF